MRLGRIRIGGPNTIDLLERWYDAEDSCFIDDDLRPLPTRGEQGGLTSTPT